MRKRKPTTAERRLATESTKSGSRLYPKPQELKSINRRREYPTRRHKNEKDYDNDIEKKQTILAALLLAANISAFAQGNGMAGITEATSMVTSYFDPATKLIYAIGAVVGLIGGIKVYGKFSSGDPDTSKTAASWFGACIFLIVSATILRSFFL